MVEHSLGKGEVGSSILPMGTTLLRRSTSERLQSASARIDMSMWLCSATEPDNDINALVLMDVQMPVMDGLTAAAKLRELEQVRGQPRQVVLALTANALAGDKDMCLSAGMDDYLTKPVTMDNISKALRRWLHGQEESAATNAPETQQTKSEKTVVTIDLSPLRATFGDAADGLIPQLLTSYLAEGMRDMEVLRQASDQTDMNLLVRIVHNLKSSSATLGIGDFSTLCREAEQLGRQGDRAAMLATFPLVVEQFAQVRAATEALLASMQAGGASA